MLATYLINRSSSPLLNNKSSYELLIFNKPSYSHLKVFDCLCFATNISPHKAKFDTCAKRCVFLGYKLSDLDAKSIFVYCDVVFDENSFPFQNLIPIFVSQSDFVIRTCVNDIDYCISIDVLPFPLASSDISPEHYVPVDVLPRRSSCTKNPPFYL